VSSTTRQAANGLALFEVHLTTNVGAKITLDASLLSKAAPLSNGSDVPTGVAPYCDSQTFNPSHWVSKFQLDLTVTSPSPVHNLYVGLVPAAGQLIAGSGARDDPATVTDGAVCTNSDLFLDYSGQPHQTETRTVWFIADEGPGEPATLLQQDLLATTLTVAVWTDPQRTPDIIAASGSGKYLQYCIGGGVTFNTTGIPPVPPGHC
jgi:hypothetical protein